MEFLIGVAVTCLVIFGISVFLKSNKFNKLTLLPFVKWCSTYQAAEEHDRLGIARALVLQTFHLAVDLGVLTVEEKQELGKESMKEDPTILVNAWLESALPIVEKELSVIELGNSEARMVGVLMLVTLKGVNPQPDLQNFLQRFNH